jgi:hypothetical protein
MRLLICKLELDTYLWQQLCNNSIAKAIAKVVVIVIFEGIERICFDCNRFVFELGLRGLFGFACAMLLGCSARRTLSLGACL